MSWVGWRCQGCRHEMRNNPRFCPIYGYTVYDPIHDHERPDWVDAPQADQPEYPEDGQSRPESPQGNPTVVTTSAEGSKPASDAHSPVPTVFLALWWSPSGGYFEQAPDDPATFDALMVGDGIGSEGLPADAQRLVPVGPLLELRDRMERLATNSQYVSPVGSEWTGYCVRELRTLLASLLGESPEPNAQEGNHDDD